jgi:intracellular septation protein
MSQTESTPSEARPATERPPENALVKLALELGPLAIFFIANARAGIFAATGIFMVAVLVSLVVSRKLTGKWPIMPVISAIVVTVFGGLTLILHDDLFIKLKPTIVNTLFGSVLLGGLAFGKPLLSIVFDSVFNLTQDGWKKLTFRWALFFFFLALVNEVVWRTQTTDFWVAFKVFGIMPITLVFGALQYPLLVKYDAGEKS